MKRKIAVVLGMSILLSTAAGCGANTSKSSGMESASSESSDMLDSEMASTQAPVVHAIQNQESTETEVTEDDTQIEIIPMVKDSQAKDLKSFLSEKPEQFAQDSGLDLKKNDDIEGFTGYNDHIQAFWSSNHDGYSVWYTKAVSHIYMYGAQPGMQLADVETLYENNGLKKDTASGMEQYFINDNEYITIEYSEENTVLALKYSNYLGSQQ